MELRETILQKSYELFYKNGFHDSGVELLAKQVGATKRTLYAHFGNKEGLIEAVLNYRHQMFMAQLKDYFERGDVKSAEDVARGYLGFLTDWTSSKGFHGCMFINACAEYSNAESIPNQIAKQHKIEVRKWLFEQFKVVGVNHAQQIADTLFVWGEGLIVTAQTGQASLDLDTTFFRQFTQGCSKAV